jgi:hypothetical protein
MAGRKSKRVGTGQLIELLYSLKHSFSRESGRQKLDAVEELSQRTLKDPRALIRYHDILCFMQAYPANAILLKRVDEELGRFDARIDLFRQINGPDDDRLDGTGIVDTFIRYSYSYPMSGWLFENFGRDVDIDWEDYSLKEDDPLSGLLNLFALYAENDGVDDEELTTDDWITEAKGSETMSLQWLLERFDSLNASLPIRQHIYDSAEIGLKWFLGKSKTARTLARIAPDKIFYQRSDLKKAKIDLRRSAGKARPDLRLQSTGNGKYIISRLISALLPRHRELYPATYANPSEVYVTSPGRGLKIYILGMRPDDRMPLETNYSGLLVKNGVPIGYAIAVLFFERCEIAINVFDTFRSGEASIIFDHFFRVFYHHFGARAFIMRRWQVGHENEEGLQSGSFWFYYKQGFRPIDVEVDKLARQELEKIRGDHTYRCDLRTLRKLAVSDLVVDLRPRPRSKFKELSVSDIGIALTRHIASNFAGDGRRAHRALRTKALRALGNPDTSWWTGSERLQLDRWCDILGVIPDLASWKKADKRDLLRLIRSRGGIREKHYVGLLQRHEKLQEAFVSIAELGSH